MRAKLSIAALILLAGCAKAPTDAERDITTADNAAPAIDVTAAPGVAFSYDYRFRLPSAKIAAAQEAHQQACERLTVAHCRITGWHYRVVGENDIQGSLTFLLDPALARGFGKSAVTQVTDAGGKLAEAEITGADAGAAIKAAQTQSGQAEDEVSRLDRQLARSDLKRGDRELLEQARTQAVQLRQAAAAQVATGQASLATTPMSFDYRSGAAIRGFDASAPFTSAADLALASAQVTLAALLSVIGFAGPPALVGGGLFWLVRRMVRRRRTPLAA